MAKSSEIHSYVFIKQSLDELGWHVGNPERNVDGQVYTQNECLKNPIIREHLGADKPENVVIVRENKFMMIEAKPMHKQLELAVKEAQEYADKLNQKKILAPLATAVAGNPEDTYLIRNFYLKNGKWLEVVVNDRPSRGLLGPEIAKRLIDEDTNIIKDLQISDEVLYTKATKINEILHLGSINKNNRARIMASILLAMADDAPINRENDAFALINEINSKAEVVLNFHKKREFGRSIAISTPPTPDNHVKFRRAILDTIQELEGINIRSAMNSGTDILGRFYEIFLKYGNGAKEIGIVLTPRHITRFAAEAVRVNKHDKVFDPACGTGGFLVAAFDHVRREVDDEDEMENFKKNGIYGIEQEPEVVALALVNMIFRGDGKNNIVEGNCFANKHFKDIKVSKVLMNPPFALKKDDEKEYKFIDLALSKMEKGGILFAVVPSPIMFRGKNFKEWRKDLLRHHTLKAVIKLPEDLFYPVGVHTSILMVEAGKPHAEEAKVLWGKLQDGLAKRKGVMIKSTSAQDNMEEMLHKIHAVLDKHSFTSSPKNWILSPIIQDAHLECAPEQYLEDIKITKQETIDGMRKVLLNAVSSQISKNIL